MDLRALYRRPCELTNALVKIYVVYDATHLHLRSCGPNLTSPCTYAGTFYDRSTQWTVLLIRSTDHRNYV